MSQYAVPLVMSCNISSLHPQPNGIAIHKAQVKCHPSGGVKIVPAVRVIQAGVDNGPSAVVIDIVKNAELRHTQGMGNGCAAA